MTTEQSALEVLRREYTEGRAALEQLVPAPGRTVVLEDSGLALGRRHARLGDRLLQSLFEVSACDARAGRLRLPEGSTKTNLAEAFDAVALGGVGGYGRSALALGSDLDVRLVARDSVAATIVAE